VLLLDQDTRSIDIGNANDPNGYLAAFTTAPTDLAHLDPRLATVQKHGDFLEMVLDSTGNYTMDVDIIWDGVTRQTVVFNLGTAGQTLGSFILGTDQLGGGQVLNRKKRIVGSGRFFSIRGKNNRAGQDFSIGRFYLHFRTGDERL
jgi:hypothetical protein